METIEHFAKISLVARLLGREHLISREEVARLQGLRGMYGIAAPAPLCADGSSDAAADQVLCQVLESPASDTERLVPDVSAAMRQDPGPRRARLGDGVEQSRDGEIRLTYGELTALITDAVRNLRD
jgi:L-fuculose-phosphate aldolase